MINEKAKRSFFLSIASVDKITKLLKFKKNFNAATFLCLISKIYFVCGGKLIRAVNSRIVIVDIMINA